MTTDRHSLGPIRLAPGVKVRHVLCYLFAAWISIGIFTYFSALTPYILRINLALPESEHGRISGNLQFWQEIVLLLSIGWWGALSDRIGRRAVYVTGFLVLSLGYTLYAFATSPAQLFAFRMVLGLGIAASSAMLATILADYADDSSRGKLIGISFFLNGIGAVIFFLGLTKLPMVFEQSGADQVWAGRYAFSVVGAICFVSALVMLGLKPGRPDESSERIPLARLMTNGLAAAARSPRIALCYGSAFAARADMVIITLFITLWVVQAGTSAGMSPSESTARAGMVVGIVLGASLLWSPVYGFIGDRFNRISVLILGFILAALGYGGIALLADPTGPVAIPALILMGMGQSSTIVASTLLLSHEAPAQMRGSVFGMQSFFGGLGILIISVGGGRLYDAVGPQAPFAAMGIANGLIVLWGIALKMRERRRAGSQIPG